MANVNPWVDPSTSDRNCISKPTFFLKACQENHNVHCMLPCKMVKRLRACPQPNSASCKPKSFASSSKSISLRGQERRISTVLVPERFGFSRFMWANRLQTFRGDLLCIIARNPPKKLGKESVWFRDVALSLVHLYDCRLVHLYDRRSSRSAQVGQRLGTVARRIACITRLALVPAAKAVVESHLGAAKLYSSFNLSRKPSD